ncbi:hypothetical protein [Microbacterium sp. K5D]|uniref:hypothetical protein n=1 Tax=Microbacterium sp. K5D TaxID=2305436 RepID=UPI0014449605|nr:hypothetical protein [Microbacterium sp. K5D]
MSDHVRVRKDGRPLYFDHPVTGEDMINYLSADEEKALRATLCGKSQDADDESIWDA